MQHLLRQNLQRRQALVLFAARQVQHLIGHPTEGGGQFRALMTPDILRGNHEQFSGFRRQKRGGATDNSALYGGVVAPRGCLHAKRGHTNFVPFRVPCESAQAQPRPPSYHRIGTWTQTSSSSEQALPGCAPPLNSRPPAACLWSPRRACANLRPNMRRAESRWRSATKTKWSCTSRTRSTPATDSATAPRYARSWKKAPRLSKNSSSGAPNSTVPAASSPSLAKARTAAIAFCT